MARYVAGSGYLYVIANNHGRCLYVTKGSLAEGSSIGTASCGLPPSASSQRTRMTVRAKEFRHGNT